MKTSFVVLELEIFFNRVQWTLWYIRPAGDLKIDKGRYGHLVVTGHMDCVTKRNAAEISRISFVSMGSGKKRWKRNLEP
jgi:hypothetical protein